MKKPSRSVLLLRLAYLEARIASGLHVSAGARDEAEAHRENLAPTADDERRIMKARERIDVKLRGESRRTRRAEELLRACTIVLRAIHRTDIAALLARIDRGTD